MPFRIQKVQYYHTTVADKPGEAYKLLSAFSGLGINLQAFNAVPIGPDSAQLRIFPEDSIKFEDTARKSGVNIEGPHPALLVQGDDELGAFTGIHEKLFKENINIFASNGLTDGSGSYAYLIFVRPEDFEKAVAALEI